MEHSEFHTSGDEDEELGVDSEEEEILHFSSEEMTYGVGSADREFGIASCQTLTPDLISKKMFEIIKEVNDVFQVRICKAKCLGQCLLSDTIQSIGISLAVVHSKTFSE